MTPQESNAAQSGGGSFEDPAARRLTHLARDADGKQSARMVDVGAKPATERAATARAVLEFPSGVLERVLAEAGPKGPIDEVARVAGILGAKRTSELIPMCHGLSLSHVEIHLQVLGPGQLAIECRAACYGSTGVEMEAMTGASIAALTVYDMVKGLDHGVRIAGVELLEKSGGRSGHWTRAASESGRERGDTQNPAD